MFKQLSGDKVTTSEYQARKEWSLDDSVDQLTFHAGANLEPPYYEDRSPENEAGTDVRGVYEMIRHLYYREDASIYDRFGVLDPSAIDLSTFPRDPRAIIYVLKVSSKLYGKRIAPGSVEISTNQEDESLTAVDDGQGNLLLEGTNTVIGNVFYPTGTLVLTRRPEEIFRLPDFTVWPNYTFEEIVFDESIANSTFPDYNYDVFDLLFRDFDIQFRSVVSNYENEIAAKVETDEFGATTNPTGRQSRGVPIEALEDGNFRPYVTTAGFYNDDFELIATGKISRPVKFPDSTPFTILARFDT